MASQRPNRGGNSFFGFLWLLVSIAVIFLGIKLLPPYISNYQLQDAMNNVAISSTYGGTTTGDIQKSVITRAKSIGIPLPADQVKVLKGNGTVEINVQYTVPVDLFVRRVDLHFEPVASNTDILK